MRTTVEGSRLLVHLSGQVTGASCPELRDIVLRRRPEGVRDVQLDAAEVTAVDDAVFSVLLAGAAWLRVSGGRMSFVSASVSVRRSLAALKLTLLLPVEDAAKPLPAVPALPLPVQRAAADSLVADLTVGALSIG